MTSTLESSESTTTENRKVLLKNYQSLNPNYIKCLKILADFYLKKPNFRKEADELFNDSKKKYGRFDGLKEIVLNSVLMRNIKTNIYPVFPILIDKKLVKSMLVYSHGSRGRKQRPNILLDTILYRRGHKKKTEESRTSAHKVVLVSGVTDNEAKMPLVVKYYKNLDHDTHNIQYEIKMYDKIRKTGARMPFYSTSYRICEESVLVMEKLEEISGLEDDPFVVGIHVLEQLRHMHTIGVHNDIKPGNIMKRVIPGPKEGSKPNTEYFLIDYGGFTDEKLRHGYRRKVWTKNYTSQAHIEPRKDKYGRRVHIKQITSPLNDLIELGFTMRSIQLHKVGVKSDGKNNRTGFEGKLDEYMNYVDALGSEGVASGEESGKKLKAKHYKDLNKILSGK